MPENDARWRLTSIQDGKTIEGQLVQLLFEPGLTYGQHPDIAIYDKVWRSLIVPLLYKTG